MRPGSGGRVPKRSANRRRDMGYAAAITMRLLVARPMHLTQALHIKTVTIRARRCCAPILRFAIATLV